MHPKKQNCFIKNVILGGRYFLGSLFPLSILLFLYSCSDKEPLSNPAVSKVDSFPPPKVTILADLPDSLQPKVVYLDKVPKPKTHIFTIPPPTKTFVNSVTGLALPLCAQGLSSFTHFDSDDGLAGDEVHCSFLDHSGHLWFGTPGYGVSRFDGKTFTTFSTAHGLINNSVWNISQDKSENIWFSTFGGISCFDGKKFTNYTTEQGLPFNDVVKMEEDELGKLWFATIGGGVSRFDGKTFTNYGEANGLTSKFVFSIEKDKEGKLWFGTRGGGVFTIAHPTSDTIKFIEFAGPQEWINDIVYCILEDSKGQIWFGTQYDGLYVYNGRSMKHFTSADGTECPGINNILEDEQGTIWLATCKGFSRLIDSTFIGYSTKNGLTSNAASSIVSDKSGYIWLSTEGGGISRYNGESTTGFIGGPVNNNVINFTEDLTGNIWFATNSDGLSRFDGKTIITLSTDQGIATNTVNFITEDRIGRFWFSTYYGGGVGCLDFNFKSDLRSSTIDTNPLYSATWKSNKGQLTTYTTTQGLALDAAYGITEDRLGQLWFCTYGGGLSRFDGTSFTNYTTVQGLASNDVYNAFEDSRGNLWVMYLGANGISVFNGKSISNFTTSQGIPNKSIWSMTEDKDGNLWFASGAGLVLLRAEEVNEMAKRKEDTEFSVAPHFETFTTQQGLPTNNIIVIINDPQGNLLLGTPSGLVQLNGGLKAFTTPGGIELYGANEGYPWKNVSAILRDRYGNIWISTNSDKEGLVRFDPSKVRIEKQPPLVILKSVKINNELITWYDLQSKSPIISNKDTLNIPAYITDEVLTFGKELSDSKRDSLQNTFGDIKFDSIRRWYPIPINLVLPFQNNNVTIDFNAVVTNRHQMVRYQYMLEGYDSDWGSPTENSSATFGNIHEGHYTFKVKARSPDGIWSEPVSYAFTVLPPLHRTWWAYSLYGMMFLGLIISGHRYQKKRTIIIERKKAEQKQVLLNERLRISRDLHDEVGATLSGISMYSHLAKEQIKSEHQSDLLNSLSIMQESSGEMVNKLNDIVWLLNPDQAQLHQLIEKLEAYARQMADINAIQVTVDITEKVSEIELPIEVRKNVYLIFKEAINNTIKYSRATTLDLAVRDLDHTLEITLHDNGIGFDPGTIKKGNGLDNMYKRAEEISALINLYASPGNGTRLSLTYKLSS